MGDLTYTGEEAGRYLWDELRPVVREHQYGTKGEYLLAESASRLQERATELTHDELQDVTAAVEAVYVHEEAGEPRTGQAAAPAFFDAVDARLNGLSPLFGDDA